MPPAVDPVDISDGARITGTVEEGAELTADGEAVEIDDDGGFTLRYERPPAGPVTLEAADRAGNRTTASVVVPITYPGMRGVHVTAAAWSDPLLRAGVLALIDQGRIDTVALDLKDEAGIVGYDTAVPRALEIGCRGAALRPRGGGGRHREPRRPGRSAASSPSRTPSSPRRRGRPGRPPR